MKKVTQQHTRDNYKPPSVNLKIEPNKVVRQELKRDLPKIAPATPPYLIEKVRAFMNPQANYYLGFGGLGDALLLLATCWDDPKAKVVYFANQTPFVKQFFELFKIPVFLEKNIMGTKLAGQIFDLMTHNQNFKQSAHLADGLYFEDWRNEDKYIKRIKNYVPWSDYFGAIKTNFPILIVGPSGSHKDPHRQRYLNQEEYKSIVNKGLDEKYKVFASGSVSDLHYYKLIQRENFHWLTSDKIYNWNGTSEDINLKKMLQIINGAEKVISMDTWLKTYTLLCNINTIVVKTRWDNNYITYGDDVTDWIFLNNKIWPNLKLEQIENLL